MLYSNRCRKINSNFKKPIIIEEEDDDKWFENYFDFKEENINDELPLIYKSIKYTKVENLFKNINFHIKNKQFDVGDFGIFTLKQLKKYQKSSLFENDPDYEEKWKYKEIEYYDIDNINHDEHDNIVFQVETHINLLETSNNNISKNVVTNYYKLNSFSSKLSLSSPIGIFFRKYLLFLDSENKQQTEERQINIFENAFNKLNFISTNIKSGVNNIYYNNKGFINIILDGEKYEQSKLRRTFNEELQVGVHFNTSLISEYDKKITQVCCSVLPFKNDDKIKPYAIEILITVYKCTLQVAVNKLNTLDETITVYLITFGYSIEWVNEALTEVKNKFNIFPLNIIMIIPNYINLDSVDKKYLKYKKKYLNLKKILVWGWRKCFI